MIYLLSKMRKKQIFNIYLGFFDFGYILKKYYIEEKKVVFFLIELTCLTHQPMVGQAKFIFLEFTNK